MQYLIQLFDMIEK